MYFVVVVVNLLRFEVWPHAEQTVLHARIAFFNRPDYMCCPRFVNVHNLEIALREFQMHAHIHIELRLYIGLTKFTN